MWSEVSTCNAFGVAALILDQVNTTSDAFKPLVLHCNEYTNHWLCCAQDIIMALLRSCRFVYRWNLVTKVRHKKEKMSELGRKWLENRAVD